MSEKAFQDYYPDDYSYCYGCGRLNPAGLHIKTYWDGDETISRYTPRPEHMAVPGFVYGGLIASLIDCNGTGAAVDLSGWSLGWGGSDYAYATLQLSGEVPAGSCFLVGGPSSELSNGSPTFDQAEDFEPVDLRQLQIEQDQGRKMFRIPVRKAAPHKQVVQGLDPVAGHHDRVQDLVLLQSPQCQLRVVLVILDEQNHFLPFVHSFLHEGDPARLHRPPGFESLADFRHLDRTRGHVDGSPRIEVVGDPAVVIDVLLTGDVEVPFHHRAVHLPEGHVSRGRQREGQPGEQGGEEGGPETHHRPSTFRKASRYRFAAFEK